MSEERNYSVKSSKVDKSVKNEDGSKEIITSFDLYLDGEKKRRIYYRVATHATGRQKVEWYKNKSSTKYSSLEELVESYY